MTYSDVKAMLAAPRPLPQPILDETARCEREDRALAPPDPVVQNFRVDGPLVTREEATITSLRAEVRRLRDLVDQRQTELAEERRQHEQTAIALRASYALHGERDHDDLRRADVLAEQTRRRTLAEGSYHWQTGECERLETELATRQAAARACLEGEEPWEPGPVAALRSLLALLPPEEQ